MPPTPKDLKSTMPDRLEIQFAPLSAPREAAVAVLAGEELRLSPLARKLDEQSEGAVLRAAEAAEFKGKRKTSIELLAPAQLDSRRLLLIGTGDPSELNEGEWVNLGGYAYG